MILWSRLLTLTQTKSNQDWAHHFNAIRQSALNSLCHLSHHWKEWGTKMWVMTFPSFSRNSHSVLHVSSHEPHICFIVHIFAWLLPLPTERLKHEGLFEPMCSMLTQVPWLGSISKNKTKEKQTNKNILLSLLL